MNTDQILPVAPLDPVWLPILREALVLSYGGRWVGSAASERIALNHGLVTYGGPGVGYVTTIKGDEIMGCR